MVPLVSVIIPTHNRADLIVANLSALSKQTWPADDFEVIVVADACEDETASIVNGLKSSTPFALRLIEHTARSASATRNRGAQDAKGKFLLFLDDDVIPAPEFIQAHMDAGGDDTVVLGYSRPVYQTRPDWWQQRARLWWEDSFRRMERPGHRFTFRDFFSGNVLIPADLFQSVGGFDLSITGRLEDYELGIRLLESGAKFKFVRAAIGEHHERTNLDVWLRRQSMEAIANVHIGYRHPSLRNVLFAEFNSETVQIERVHRWVRAIAFKHPDFHKRIETFLLNLTHFSEKYRLRGPYWYASKVLREMAYWRGVSQVFDTEGAFMSYLQEGPNLSLSQTNDVNVDLAHTATNAELDEALRRASGAGVVVLFDGLKLMRIIPEVGAEKLEARHLMQELRERATHRFYASPAFQSLLFSLEERQ